MAIVTPGLLKEEKAHGELGDGAGSARGGECRRRKTAAQLIC
jgi:hypothetical protein